MQRIQKTISEFIEGAATPTVSPDATVQEAVEVMAKSDTTCVLVVSDEELIGVFTGRDFLNRVAAKGRVPTDTLIRSVMTPAPDTLSSTDCISYAIQIMAGGGFRHVPVVDNERVRGLLSVKTVVEHLTELISELDDDDYEAPDVSGIWIDIGGG
jgi:CBS domain-containing protein